VFIPVIVVAIAIYFILRFYFLSKDKPIKEKAKDEGSSL